MDFIVTLLIWGQFYSRQYKIQKVESSFKKLLVSHTFVYKIIIMRIYQEGNELLSPVSNGACNYALEGLS